MSHESTSPAVSSVGSRPDVATHHPVVLVIEDDDALRREIAEVLEMDGYLVLQAADGAVALEMLRRTTTVDAIFLDLWMPDMDGWTFRTEQRADPSIRDIPVVVLSADNSPQARAIDADAFVRKPFDGETLSTTARRVIATSRANGRQAAKLVSETVSLLAGAISHEVADPLMSLIASLERLRGKDAPATPAEYQTAANAMMDQCWRIAGALRTLRDLPFPTFAREREVDVAQLVRAALAWTGGDRLRFRCESGSAVTTHGDPLVIVYLCTAVLRNAIEAVPKEDPDRKDGEPDIDVRLSRVGDEILLDVRDRGPSIPEADLKRLFSVEYPGRERAWSTGLRLWFVRQAVIGMGGSVEISNAQPRGVRCLVRLPAAPLETRHPSLTGESRPLTAS